jgi:hypothetical protein
MILNARAYMGSELGVEACKSLRSLWIAARDALGLAAGFSGICDDDANVLSRLRRALSAYRLACAQLDQKTAQSC